MLEHLATKFTTAPAEPEPRAALIVNRFTRSLAIMFATNSVSIILGLEPAQLQNKSFYECIQDSCLDDATECLESAKANDSIAYLRFWSRDARREEDLEEDLSDSDEGSADDIVPEDSTSDPGTVPTRTATTSQDSVAAFSEENAEQNGDSSDSDRGGVRLDGGMDVDSPLQSTSSAANNRGATSNNAFGNHDVIPQEISAGHNEGPSAKQPSNDPQASAPHRHGAQREASQRQRQPPYPVPSVELEAVVSCTSDGLVVVLRKARPIPAGPVPSSRMPHMPRHGIFASPWAPEPFRPRYAHEMVHEFRAPYAPQHMPVREEVRSAGGPPMDQLMSSIREVAVFAWALVGINKNLSVHSHGNPSGDAQPQAQEEMRGNGQPSGMLLSPHEAKNH